MVPVRVVSTRGEATIDQPVSNQQEPDGMFLAAVQPPCTVRLVVRRNIQCSGITLENGGRREGAHCRGDMVTKMEAGCKDENKFYDIIRGFSFRVRLRVRPPYSKERPLEAYYVLKVVTRHVPGETENRTT
jgi:hypothetical protein